MKNQSRPIHIQNGAIPGNEVVVYDNPNYDEEMVIPANRQIRSLSKTDSIKYENVGSSNTDGRSENVELNKRDSVKYENVELSKSGTQKNAMQSNHSTDNAKDNETQSVYENMHVKPKPAEKANNAHEVDKKAKEQNGSVQNVTEPKQKHRFDKKEQASSNKARKTAVAKKASPSSNLSKAASAIDVSTQPKLDKSSQHKQSAPCLGTEPSTPVDIEALKASGSSLSGTKVKSNSAHELRVRRSSADGSVASGSEDLRDIPEEDENKGNAA